MTRWRKIISRDGVVQDAVADCDCPKCGGAGELPPDPGDRFQIPSVCDCAEFDPKLKYGPCGQNIYHPIVNEVEIKRAKRGRCLS